MLCTVLSAHDPGQCGYTCHILLPIWDTFLKHNNAEFAPNTLMMFSDEQFAGTGVPDCSDKQN